MLMNSDTNTQNQGDVRGGLSLWLFLMLWGFVPFAFLGAGLWIANVHSESLLEAAQTDSNTLKIFHDVRDVWITLMAGAFISSAIIALIVSSRIRRILSALNAEGERSDILERNHGYWPKTRIRELNQITHAFDTLRTISREHLDALDLHIKTQGPAVVKNVEFVVVEEEAPLDLTPLKVLEDEEETGIMEGTVEATQDTTHSPTGAGADAAEPPAAFLQALQQARTQLRERNESLIKAQSRLQRFQEVEEERDSFLQRFKNLFVTISEKENATRDIPNLLEQFAEVFAVARVSLWRWDDGEGMSLCLGLYDDLAKKYLECSPLRRRDSMLFFSALESESCIAIQDVAHDPRVQSMMSHFKESPKAQSMVFCKIHQGVQALGWLCLEEVTESRSWAREEVLGVYAVACLLQEHLGELPAPEHEAQVPEQEFEISRSIASPLADQMQYQNLFESTAVHFHSNCTQ